MKLFLLQALTVVLPTLVASKAILGVDLGSLYMKVALVQSGSPLEIVTNLHSKRKTEQMILFDREQRFYGADASSLLARKSHKTPSAMSIMLGRDDQHPVVRVLSERHYPIRPVYNETRSGVVLTVDGQDFTPEELVAMVLSHAVDISVAHAASQGSTIAPPSECTLTTPMYSTQTERKALLDAAALADLKVLGLIDENTAAALHFAMDKNFEDDNEKLLIFYNMGASALQVSLIRFFNYEQPQKFGKPKSVPALEVLSKAWDETLGGQAFDHVLVEYMADLFNEEWNKKTGTSDKDVRKYPRAMTKLRLQANKVKHVLSANTEFPVYLDNVQDDLPLQVTVSRSKLEELGEPLWARAVAPVTAVLSAANKTSADLSGMELIGGAMRVPRLQTELAKVVGKDVDIGMHINADDSMALGAAFAGANVSTAFRVRQVGMTDINPFPISVALNNLGDESDEDGETWSKQATLFKAFNKMGLKKTIAFTHDKDVFCALDYEDSELLPEGSQKSLERYNITGITEFAKEMKEKGLGVPKVSLQFELDVSGISGLVKAEASVEETYTVEEEVEVDDDGNELNSTETAKKTKTDKEDDKNTTDGEEKEKKTKTVEREKKRYHKKSLKVSTFYEGRVQPHSPEIMEASKKKLLDMAARDKERMMLEEMRNNVEGYMYKVKNGLAEDEDTLKVFSTEKERKDLSKFADETDEWLFDEGYSADLATMTKRYEDLSGPYEKILLRIKESKLRPEAIESLKKKVKEVEELMEKWKTSKPQVTDEERGDVLKKLDAVKKWISDNTNAQSKKKDHEDPAFLSSEVATQMKPVESLVVRLNRKPKPKPKKEEKPSESESTESNESNSTEPVDNNSTETDAPTAGPDNEGEEL